MPLGGLARAGFTLPPATSTSCHRHLGLPRRKKLKRAARLVSAPRFFPGRGRLLAAPRSEGTFYRSKVLAALAWWQDPLQSTPSQVLRWVSQGVKVEFAHPMRELHLAPRLVHPADVAFVLADQEKGHSRGAYVGLAPGGAQFLSRSRVHTTGAGKQRMVHALCALNEATVKRPAPMQDVRSLPKLLRPGDYLLSADVEAAFWNVPLHASSHKFFSSHFALPASYFLEGRRTSTPLLPGGYWAWQPGVPPPPSSGGFSNSSPSSPLAPSSQHPPSNPPLLRPHPPLHLRSPAPLTQATSDRSEPALTGLGAGSWVQIVEFSHAVLPFGWTSSPRIWEAVCRVLAAALRRAGIRVLIYVDDFLLALRTRKEACDARPIIEAAFLASGLTRAPGKGQWEPSQVLDDHLGFRISTSGMGLLQVPERRCRVLRALARDLLRTAASSLRQVCSDALRVFTGTAISCMIAIPQARLRLRSLHDAQEEWRPRSVLRRAQLRDLRWWAEMSMDSPANGALLWPPPASVSMWTDASGRTGFGSVLEVPHQARRTHGAFWRAEDIPIPICVKELKAVKFGLIEHADVLAGKTVRLFQDNQAVVGAMRAFSSSSPAMMVELREIWRLLDQHAIRFTIEYIRSELNPADAPSRLSSPALWSFSPRLQVQLLSRVRWHCRRPVSLDPFACRQSAVVARYATPLFDARALAMDGLLLDWSQDCVWLVPPWDLLPAVIHKLETAGCQGGLLVVPTWPLQSWWAAFQSLPGIHFQLPPPRFCVQPHHFGRARVEPFANHAVKLRAVLLRSFSGAELAG